MSEKGLKPRTKDCKKCQRPKAEMNDKDLKPRTKAFALRVIRMYSKLPKSDTVAQVLGKLQRISPAGPAVNAPMHAALAFLQEYKSTETTVVAG